VNEWRELLTTQPPDNVGCSQNPVFQMCPSGIDGHHPSSVRSDKGGAVPALEVKLPATAFLAVAVTGKDAPAAMPLGQSLPIGQPLSPGTAFVVIAYLAAPPCPHASIIFPRQGAGTKLTGLLDSATHFDLHSGYTTPSCQTLSRTFRTWFKVQSVALHRFPLVSLPQCHFLLFMQPLLIGLLQLLAVVNLGRLLHLRGSRALLTHLQIG